MSDIKTPTTRSVAVVGPALPSMRLPQRQLLAITHDVKTGGSAWSAPVYVPFVPDTVKVRQVAYLADGKETGTYVLTCSSLGTPFSLFMDAALHAVDVTIDVRNKSINSRWQFQLQNFDGSPATTAQGKVGLVLEFIQH